MTDPADWPRLTYPAKPWKLAEAAADQAATLEQQGQSELASLYNGLTALALTVQRQSDEITALTKRLDAA